MRKIGYMFLGSLMTMLVMLTSMTAFAETANKIEVIFGRVKLMVNGQAVDKETLLYNGTTYVPLRAAAEILGQEVAWDGSTNTAYIDPKGTNRAFEEKAPVPATSEVVGYAAFPSVPDFGKVAGVEPNWSYSHALLPGAVKADELNVGGNAMVSIPYPAVAVNAEKVIAYETLLEANGFTDQVDQVYIKDQIQVTFYTRAVGEDSDDSKESFFWIQITDTRVELPY